MKVVDLSQRNLLILYGLVVTLIVLSFLMTKKGPRPPVRLQLKNKPPQSPRDVREQVRLTGTQAESPQRENPRASERPVGWENYRPRESTARAYRQAPDERPNDAIEKSLNVMFNWNGHSWDAYEVLGVPAGSSRDSVTAAYHHARAKCDAESLPFLQAAYEAICKGS